MDSIEDSTEVKKNSRVLRNRDSLKKPLWLDDYVVALAIGEEPNSIEEALEESAAEK